MKYRSRSFLSFIDFLFILLLAFISMFILALLLINPVTKKSEIERKAEYIITLEWDRKSKDDVDLWVEDPGGNILSFRNKTAGFMHLDKDDLGQINDIITLPNGSTQVILLNREVASLRGWIKGEYIVNVHMYSKRGEMPTNIVVTAIKVNPYKILFEDKLVLSQKGQEETVRRFTLNTEGALVSTNKRIKRYINIHGNSTSFGNHGEPTDAQRMRGLNSQGRPHHRQAVP